MLRRSTRRLGHQLIKEPLGNEENTYARGVRTFHHTASEIQMLGVAAVTGVIAAFWAMRGSGQRQHPVVGADGKLKKL